MSATKQINAAFSRAASSKSPMGTAFTTAEMKAGIAAAKADDGKIDARERNLIAYNIAYKGNGMSDGARDAWFDAIKKEGLPKDPVADRTWVKLNAILTAPPRAVPTDRFTANYSTPAKALETMKRAALAGDLTLYKKSFEGKGNGPGNLVSKWATQTQMKKLAADLKKGLPWELAGLGKKYDGGKAIIDMLVTGKKPDPILQVTFDRNARGEWKIGFVSDAPPLTPFGQQR
jgi:hypothetical protein